MLAATTSVTLDSASRDHSLPHQIGSVAGDATSDATFRSADPCTVARWVSGLHSRNLPSHRGNAASAVSRFGPIGRTNLKANVAIQHSTLIAIWNMGTNGCLYSGAAWSRQPCVVAYLSTVPG
jgi:hypothetical protein